MWAWSATESVWPITVTESGGVPPQSDTMPSRISVARGVSVAESTSKVTSLLRVAFVLPLPESVVTAPSDAPVRKTSESAGATVSMTGAISGIADFGGIALVAVGDRDAFVVAVVGAVADGVGVGDLLSFAADSVAGIRSPAVSAVTAAAATAGRGAAIQNLFDPLNPIDPVDPLNILNFLNALRNRWCL